MQPTAAPVGTFTGFRRGEIGGDKIDYVFASPEWEVLEGAILRNEREGRYPSDHFPVTAFLRLPE
jgi:endonuclease/exonuclease/phosphatase family metal-dependent hydrolase